MTAGAPESYTHMVEMSASGDADRVEARLREALDAHGLQLFACINHGAGARNADVELAANVLLIFDNTRVGTPLMQADPRVGIELPLRMLIWQDPDGPEQRADVRCLPYARSTVERRCGRIRAAAGMRRGRNARCSFMDGLARSCRDDQLRGRRRDLPRAECLRDG